MANTQITVLPDGKKIYSVPVTGPASYATGGFTTTVGELAAVDALMGIQMKTYYQPNGVMINAQWTITGNTFKVKLYEQDAASPGAWAEVAAMTNVATFTANVTVIGH